MGATMTVQTFRNCPEPVPQSQRGWWIGNRALLSDDGTSLVMQCGDGSMWSWRAGEVPRLTPQKSLIGSAKLSGLIPLAVHCIPISTSQDEEEKDCDIVDHATDWSSYIVHGASYWVVGQAATESVHELPGWLRGSLISRAGNATEVVTAADGYEGKGVDIHQLDNWSARRFATLPTKIGFLQDEETRVWQMSYSISKQLVVVSCEGIFMYFPGDAALIRAFDLNGVERWSMRRPLIKPEKSIGLHQGFAAIGAKVELFDEGRYAVVREDHNDSSFEVIDVGTGRQLYATAGLPIAESRSAKRILVRNGANEVVLFDLSQVLR